MGQQRHQWVVEMGMGWTQRLKGYSSLRLCPRLGLSPGGCLLLLLLQRSRSESRRVADRRNHVHGAGIREEQITYTGPAWVASDAGVVDLSRWRKR